MIDGAYVFLVLFVTGSIVVLVVSVPLFRGFVTDARERHRARKTGELEPYTPDEEFDSGPPAALEEKTGHERERLRVVCWNCGCRNDLAYRFCRECSERL
ncbi:zinc ribbon domain-containing protein [Natrialbaceae archaeon AArc-T1-2]|uniref:zinc ribbon domain-containing protein n=1 Tax=Natrialbaceae archaeon AArc-T1-2 TaxID=3053904 RepID=UPI00255A9506|nr:zinc ribbon domain-containing protein [Natrialbaceae archaeon AArc-T1-2]WIV66193.1 zinc ribbon domain-containing protein [Natrialbaceae archaeon AArc-T1-2]